MKRFRYVLDPLCLICCALYALNRWGIKPHCQIPFFHNWFNDCLLIPCALPPVLRIQRWLELRTRDCPPTFAETASHLIGWSILFEWIGPHIMPTVGDPWDAVAYAAGAAVAYPLWQWDYRKTRIKTGADFDSLAPIYSWMEWALAGGKLQRCRAAFLENIGQPRHVLIVGPGHGRFLTELLRRKPETQCTCVDSSQGMLRMLQRRLRAQHGSAQNVRFVHADVLDWEFPEKEFDVIVTHFVLDCFREEQLAQILPRLAGAATADAQWLLSDFREPDCGVARWRARAILHVMYIFFRCTASLPASKLTPPDVMLAECGFALAKRRTFEWGLLHSDLWQSTGRRIERKTCQVV